MAVCVLDRRGKPLMPCSEKRARLLLARGRARVHRVVPFVIRLVDRERATTAVQPVRIKLDPGSNTTGLALVREDPADAVHHVLVLAEIQHRGLAIRKALLQRRGYRRRRRSANLRYRAPRFDNRTRPVGWLAPSLQHRVDTTLAWVRRLCRWAPVTALSMELVRFDLQRMQNPEISGVAYQQGTLAGYEVREYLLEKWGRRCAYCAGDGVPLEIDHITPRGRGGSDRVTNLTLACHPCNQAKGNRSAAEFGHPAIQAKAKQPLGAAAAVNSTRWSLLNALTATGLAVETGTGGRTKWNRTRFGVPKTHALDAACVGVVEGVTGWVAPVLSIRCTGRGAYQRTRVTQDGFPRGYLMRHKQVRGFQTGDLVRATVPSGKKAGVHMGRVAVRATGSFNIQTPQGVVQGIGYRHCCVIQRGDGYGYAQLGATALPSPAIPPRPEGRGFSRRSG